MRIFSTAYTTTVVDHAHGFGLTVATVPQDAMSSAWPQQIDDVCEPLGLVVRRRYAHLSEACLLAALAAMVLYDGAGLVLERIENLSATASYPLEAMDPTLRAFVSDFAQTGMIPVEQQGRRSDLAQLIAAEATALAMTERRDGGDAVLAALVGLGMVVTVAPAGRGGPALAGRIAQWVAPLSVGEDRSTGMPHA